MICQRGGKRFKINYCGILKQIKNTYSISFLSCTTFREAKTICIVYHWGKNSCIGQILHSPPPPAKNYLPCLSLGKKFLHWPDLALPTPTPKKGQTCYCSNRNCRTHVFKNETYFNPWKYMCAFWQFVLRSTSKP